jgi:LemA protein
MSGIAIVVVTAVLLIIVLMWGISVYNQLVHLSKLKDEAWSGVDVQLRRRFGLSQKLIEIVRDYASRERGMLQEISDAQNAIMAVTTQDARIAAENGFTNSLRKLSALAESYTELKSDVNFLNLQKELSSVEREMQLARCYYNTTVMDFDAAIQAFPAALISRCLGYSEVSMFGSDEDIRQPIKV